MRSSSSLVYADSLFDSVDLSSFIFDKFLVVEPRLSDLIILNISYSLL